MRYHRTRYQSSKRRRYIRMEVSTHPHLPAHGWIWGPPLRLTPWLPIPVCKSYLVTLWCDVHPWNKNLIIFFCKLPYIFSKYFDRFFDCFRILFLNDIRPQEGPTNLSMLAVYQNYIYWNTPPHPDDPSSPAPIWALYKEPKMQSSELPWAALNLAPSQLRTISNFLL